MRVMREWCPLAPCLPAHGGRPNRTTITMSRSFSTHEAYLRHIERGHFIAAQNAPHPFIAAESWYEDGAA